MSNSNKSFSKEITLKPSIANLRSFLRRGYGLRDLISRGLYLKIYSKVVTHLRYSFYFRGKNVDIDASSMIEGAKFISINDGVWIQKDVRLVVPLFAMPVVQKRAYLEIGRGTQIGPRCTISAANSIAIGENVLFGINILVLDHSHRYEDINRPIKEQGLIAEGQIHIEDNVWIGANVIIYTSKDRIVIGKNSVISASSVVRKSVEPFCVVAGDPARVIKKYDFNSQRWFTTDSVHD